MYKKYFFWTILFCTMFFHVRTFSMWGRGIVNFYPKVGYYRALMDVDDGMILGLESRIAVLRWDKNERISVEYDYVRTNLGNKIFGDATSNFMHVSYLRYFAHLFSNYTGRFYYGIGPSYIMTSISAGSRENKWGLNGFVGYEVPNGLSLEVKHIWAQRIGRWNDARLGGTSFYMGYRY